MNACTIVARNYLAYARVLAMSFLEHHPHGTFTTLVTDDVARTVNDAAEPFQVVRLDELGVAEAEWHRMAAIYDVMELATAIKPFLLRHLLDGGAEDVTYFDPDIEIHADLTDISTLARTADIVITPHSTEPMPRDGRWPDELTILTSGVYNLGFIAVGRGAGHFLEWWSERTRRDSISWKERGYFVDQRWIDFVPSYFKHHILRDTGCNVAYWNLATRHVDRGPDAGWLVSGLPLRFFHYSGFDVSQPWLLSKFQADRPRILLSESPSIAELCKEYARRVLAEGHDRSRFTPYALDLLPSGLTLDHRMRRFYRAALVAAEADDAQPPPNPFDQGQSDAFRAWLTEPDRETESIGRYLMTLWHESRDLQLRYPDIHGADADAYLSWLRQEGARLSGVPHSLLPAGPAESALRRRLLTPERHPGFNLVGYVRAESGVGEVARLFRAGIERSGIPHALVGYTEAPQRQLLTVSGATTDDPRFDVNIMCINADQTPSFAHNAGPEFFANRHNVGVWHWEVEPFPAVYRSAFDHVDEVWASSEFVFNILQPVSPVPVFRASLPVTVPDLQVLPGRKALGLPDGFLFLFTFDFYSIVGRKNPKGLIEAFRRAFAPESGPTLMIKTINGDRHVSQLEELLLLAADRPDIIIRDAYLSPEANMGMVAACDCYASLHRSEGFGLGLAQAMALGKPVIATRYSGNLTFMDDRSAFLVDCAVVEVPAGNEPYPTGSLWADPDLDCAAQLLTTVAYDGPEVRRRAAAGRERVHTEHSVEAAAEFLRARFEDIHAQRPARRMTSNGQAMRGLTRRAVRRAAHTPVGEAMTRAIRHVARTEVIPVRDAVAGQDERLRAVESELLIRHSRVDQLESQIQLLTAQLTTPPYMTDPSALVTTDDLGRPAIGYRDNPGTSDVTAGFQDVFRGPEGFIRDRQRFYVELVRDQSPVVDVGCGRGEFLDLCKEVGIDAVGVDLDAAMVERCRHKGHRAEVADAAEYLESQLQRSLGAVFSAQVVEHVDEPTLLRWLVASRRALRGGGVFIAETVNPHCINAFKTFWVDLTHHVPIFPETLVTLCRLTGFASAYVVFPNGTGKLEEDRTTQGEYAVVARAPLQTQPAASNREGTASHPR